MLFAYQDADIPYLYVFFLSFYSSIIILVFISNLNYLNLIDMNYAIQGVECETIREKK